MSAISSNRVKMIKPMIINSEQFNRLDWNISKSLRRKSISVPQENIMYKTVQGDCHAPTHSQARDNCRINPSGVNNTFLELVQS